MRTAAQSHSARINRPQIELQGSLKMYTMNEALAREHMRQLESEARRHRLATEALAHRRRSVRSSERRARRAPSPSR